MDDQPIITRDDIRRLEKAAREKDKNHLRTFLAQYENQVADTYRLAYEKRFEEMTEDFSDTFLTVMMYCLIYSEETLINKDNIKGFIEDVNVSYTMLGKGELKEVELKDQLIKDGVSLSTRMVDPFNWIRKERDRLNIQYEHYKEAIEKIHKYIDKFKLN